MFGCSHLLISWVRSFWFYFIASHLILFSMVWVKPDISQQLLDHALHANFECAEFLFCMLERHQDFD